MNKIIGNHIFRLLEIDSTNQHLQNLNNQKMVVNGDIVIAKNQTRGKGQGNNAWISEPGKNLNMSLFLQPDYLQPEKQFFLTVFISLSIHDLLADFTDKISIKWPNDIFSENRKICGVLIENAICGYKITSSVIGVGLNVNQTEFPENIKNAVSLKELTGKKHDVEKILSIFIDKLNYRYGQLVKQDFLSMKKEYLNKMYLFQKTAMFQSMYGEIEGYIGDVLDTGELVFFKKGNPEPIYFSFKEIQFPKINT